MLDVSALQRLLERVEVGPLLRPAPSERRRAEERTADEHRRSMEYRADEERADRERGEEGEDRRPRVLVAAVRLRVEYRRQQHLPALRREPDDQWLVGGALPERGATLHHGSVGEVVGRRRRARS